VVLRRDVAEGACRQQHQYRAQALAAAVDDVGGNLVDQDDFRLQARMDDGIDRSHVFGDGGLYELERHGVRLYNELREF
jgi:hypothetical protein